MTGGLSRRDFIGQARKVALATPFISLVGCSEAAKDEVAALSGSTMGTTYSVKIVGLPDHFELTAVQEDIDQALEEINRQMSTYRPDSELSRFNASEPGVWSEISPATEKVVSAALRVSDLTKGAFDPSVGPLVDLWGFGPTDNSQRVPTAEEIASAQTAVGFESIEVNTDGPALKKQKPGLTLDLSGVAKGYGVDQVAELLETRGITDYLVEVGGELRSNGKGPEGRAWRVGIEKPEAASGGLQRVVELDRAALATSGNYRLFFEADGRSYTHIIDPKTGMPVDHKLVSATVVADTTMEADALSTSMLVLGPDAGLALAEANGIAAYFILSSDEGTSTIASTAFQDRFGS